MSSLIPVDAQMPPGWTSAHLQPRVGRLVALNEGRPMVDFPGNQVGPVVARTTVDLSQAQVEEGKSSEVLLVFNEGRPLEPIIIGLLQPAEPEPTHAPVETSIDGNRVVLTGQEEIELRCGQARIVLRKNGRISVRGVYVETRAKGVNRIKGGSVQIN